MAEERIELLAVRALLPAAILAAAFWLADFAGAGANFYNLPLLAGAYLTGAATLIYAEKALKIAKTAGFQIAYAGCVAMGGALGIAMLGMEPRFLPGVVWLALLMLLLPVLFDRVMERVKRVQPE